MLYSVHFLRFIAAAAVVFHHASSYGPSPGVLVGAAGVDVFFVISGLVIGLSTVSAQGAAAFFIKRFIRVIPLYWVATVVYIAFRYWAWKEIPTAETVWRSFTLIPVSGTNWVPIYFPGWSIGYELYFYIAVGVALLLYPRLFFTISAITVLTIAVVRVPVPFTHHMRYFQSDWGLEFFFGLMICSGYRAGVRLSHVEGAICLVVSCCLFALNASGNVLPRVLAWGVPSALMVVGALALEGLPLFRNRWFRWGGDASYAIYLFHIPVIEWLRETATKHYVDLNGNRTLTIAVTASLAIASGLLVNRYFESPLLHWLRKRLLPKRGDSRQAARLGNSPQPALASAENASVDLASREIRLDQGS